MLPMAASVSAAPPPLAPGAAHPAASSPTATTTSVLVLAPARPPRDDVAGPAPAQPRPADSAPSSARAASTGAGGAFYQAKRAISVGQMLSAQSSCTATVVSSSTGSVAVTAAHCVYQPQAGPMAGAFAVHGWVALEEFVPGRAGDTAPYGRWQIEHAWVDSRWQTTGDIAYDVAFLRIRPQHGRSIQDVVGSQGIAFTTPAAGTAVTALGYPVEAPFDGRSLRRCFTSAVTIERSAENALTMRCAMTPGSSGGPWLTGFDAAAGAGTVVAVTSFHDDTGLLSARPVSDTGYPLYQAADHNSTADQNSTA
ncbi:MAG: hypothetical protein ABS80_16100 [Pseudonocardia sp. SCN 72-51]|nr:MAG: hypothetical protein ABS80_16100 [Pseudonocardia sp. SCN 72-51]